MGRKNNKGRNGATLPADDGNAQTAPDPILNAEGMDTNVDPGQEETVNQDEGGTTPPTNEGGQSETGGGNHPPPPEPPKPSPQPADKGEMGARRIRNAMLKGKKFNIGNGEIVAVDGEGVFEVEAAAAERLLAIPGFEEV